ncbi:type II secretion system protein F [Veronia nyctiphanis]|uniref:Type II secretion system protein F n=1 Tax=Veronia nyctiphanis TaxID=1278244 RepID=A0A4Q0YNE8_9GAMM|nr:type II secretion system F family protein [Veronia nyctiphanis]RXJ72470.1 type II secretion system protein F [Veronia nyctiphanis]
MKDDNKKQKLSAFHWRGTTLKGKKVKGQMLAMEESVVRAALADQQIKIQKIRKRGASSLQLRQHTAKPEDITLFSRQMCTMLTAGVPLIQAMQLVRSSCKKAGMKHIISQVCQQIEAGSSFSQALRTSSPLFDEFFCDLVFTGEMTGQLDKVFGRISLQREKQEDMRRKVKKAMIYPSIVSFIALGVTIFMLIFVIPKFEEVFSSFDTELPWFTLQILKASDFITQHGVAVGLLSLVAVLLFRQAYVKYMHFRLKISHFSLKIPIFGDIFTKASISRFSRTLATTFSAGIPLLTGLQSSAKTAGNLHLQRVVEDIQKKTAAGQPMHIAIRESGEFPELLTQMVMIGEESGSLDDMLNKVAAIYEEDVDNTVDNLGKIIEPMIILVLGGVIGSLVIGMYLPIFDLMSVIG